jgi:hypothetical protein
MFFFVKTKIKTQKIFHVSCGSFLCWKKRLAVLLIGTLLMPSFASPAHALFGYWESSLTVPDVGREKLVSILVEESLLENIKLKNKIENYAASVQSNINGEVVLVPVPTEASPLDIYEGNAHLYFSGNDSDGRSQLVGTIFIGDVPLPVVEKSGNLWPTIFPYVDFEDPVYQWDYEKERFVFRGGGSHQAEVWHGVIRSDPRHDEGWDAKKLKDFREKELITFFQTNEQVNSGSITYDKNIFSADLVTDQANGLDATAMGHYENWVNNIEDIVYMRYTKHWAAEVMGNIEADDIIDTTVFPDSMKPPTESEDAGTLMGNVPDIHTKLIIEKGVKRYIETWKEKLSIDNAEIEKTGRWDPADIESTIVLISEKDERAAVNLKAFNDILDATLNTAIVAENVPKDIKVKTTENVPISYVIPQIPPLEDIAMTQDRDKDMYWNGVSRATMAIEDCSILRGSLRTDQYPHAQMVEANRAYNPGTSDEDYPTEAAPDYLCENIRIPVTSNPNWGAYHAWWDEDSDDDGTLNYIDLGEDLYESCCALNSEFLQDSFEYVNDYCEIGSEWVIRDYKGLGDQTPYAPEATDAPTLTNQYRDHVGTTEPVFDITATKESLTGTPGAEGCSTILDVDGDHSMDSLVYHIEPQNSTILAQMEDMGSIAMPVDKPRGFSFYDEQWDFHRINYFNAFSLIGRHSEVTDEAARRELLKQEILNGLQDKIEELNDIIRNNATENIDLIDTTLFDIHTGDLDDIVDSIIWIDKTIESKNRLMFEIAFSPAKDAQEFLFNDDFHDGYEFAQITAEKAVSGSTGEEGISMGFEQGSAPDSEQFQDAKLEASEFSFDDGADTEDIHKQDEEHFDFSGQESSQSACKGKNILSWFPCFINWLSELPNIITQNFTVLPDPPKNGNEDSDEPAKPTVLPPSGGGDSASSSSFQNTVSQIKTSVPEIHIGAGNTDPVILEADLKNKAGGAVQSSSSAEVSIKFSNSNGEKFFDVFPSKSVEPVAGKAVFTLFPEDTDVGGSFDISMEVDGAVLQKIPVTVSKYSLTAVAEKNYVVVDNKEGVLIEAKVEDPDGMVSSEKDGSILVFESDWGTFEQNGHASVRNGRAEIVFFPGIRSGEATIRVQDSKKNLPPAEESVNIIAGEIQSIEIETKTETLIAGADFLPVVAQLQDKFGNDITRGSGEFIWETTNLEIQGIEKAKKFKTTIENGKKKLLIRPKHKLPAAELRVKVKLPFEEVVQVKIFTIPQKVVFSIETSEESVTAGSANPIRVLVMAETEEGERIEQNLSVNVLGEPAGMGQFLNTIEMEDGLGEFKFYAGTKAGETSLSFSSPGFETSEEVFTINPDTAVKILTSIDTETMDVDDPHAEINLDISVVDRFGNVDTTFVDKVHLLPNEPDLFLSTNRETLIDLDMIDTSGGIQYVIDEEADASRASGTSPDTSLLQTTDGWSVPMKKGKATVEMTPGSTSTGKVLMSIESAGLVPDTVEFVVTDYLTADEIDDLTPKSRFTLLTGFDGGDMLAGKGIGNRFLLSGKSQAVGTLIAPPNPKKRLGYISPAGDVSLQLKAEVRMNEYFTVEIKDSVRPIAQLHVRFEEEPEFFVKREKGTSPGIYFLPTEGLVESLVREGDTILWDDAPVFTITPQGGLQIVQGGYEFISEGSFLEWNVEKEDQPIGTLAIVPTEETFTLFDTQDRIPTEAEGIFVHQEVSDIHIKESFTGKTTNDERGLVFVDSNKEESSNKKLGAPYLSAENVQEDKEIVWTNSWKPASRYAAGNIVGESVQWNSSDAFILLGDPTTSVASENDRSTLGITEDVGKPIWKSPLGTIEQIIVADINADDVPDILNRVGKRLFALYQENSEIDNFRDTGPILRFEDGVQKVFAVDNDHDNFSDIIQLNDEGILILHRNTNGTFARAGVIINGFDGVINEIFEGNIDDDEYKNDLVFSDAEKTLWFAPGTADVGVYGPATAIERFAPSLEATEEVYIASAEQDWEKRKYFDTDKFPNLERVFVSYEGVKDDITDQTPEDAIRIEGSDDLLPENAFERGIGEGGMHFNFGSVPVSEETLEGMTSSLQGTMDEQLAQMAEQVLGDSGGAFKKTFLEIPFQMRVNGTWTLLPEGSSQLQLGQAVHAGFEFTPITDLESFEFLLPKMNGMTFEKESFSCEECDGEVQFREDIPDDVEVWGYWEQPLESGEKIELTWDLTVEDMGPLSFQVLDYKSNDTIDDILIGWEEDGEKKIIKYQSHPQNNNNTAFKHSQDIVDVTMPSDPDAPSQDALKDKYTQDDDANGLPDIWETFGTLALTSVAGAMTCRGNCGLPIPSIVIPPFAPGSQTLYVPPFAIKLPKWPMPLPMFSLLMNPSGVPTPVFYTPKGGEVIASGLISLFRIYLIPTTNASLGISFCPFPYNVGDKTQFPIGNCFTIVIPSIFGGAFCSSDDSEAGDTEDSIRNMMQDYNPADYKPKFEFNKPNKTIHTAEVISDWIRRQKAEWNNIKLPTPKLSKPKLPKTLVREKVKTVEPLFAENTKVLGRKLWKDIDQKSWVTLKPELHTFPYPVFPKTDENGDNAELEKYHIQWQAWKKAPKKYQEDKKKLKAFYNENCKGEKAQTKECEKLSKNIVSFDAFIGSVSQNEQAIAKNWEAIESYKEVPKVLSELFKDEEGEEGDMTRLGKQFKKYGDEIEIYTKEWLDANRKAIAKWKKFIKELKEFFKSIEMIFEIFGEFKNDCPTCSIERGSSTTVLINLLLGALKIPVIPAPRLPDILLDFSRIDFTVQLPVPEIELQPVELAYPDLPPPPTIRVSMGFDVPALPVIPVLPKMPEIKINVSIPELTIPVLPVLLDPPGIPNPIVKLKAIVKIFNIFLKLFCLIVRNFIPVPEHYLAGHVQQVTNRTRMIGLDFTLPSLSLNLPQLPEIEDIEIALEAHLSLPTVALEVLNATVGVFAELDQCVVDSLSKVLKGAPEGAICEAGGGGGVAFEPKTLVENKVKYNIVANVEPSYFEKTHTPQPTFAEAFTKAFASSDRILKMAFTSKRNVFSSIAPKRMARWLTSVVDVGSIPTEAPSDFDVTAFQEKQNNSFQRPPTVYYFDPVTETAESITSFPGEQITAHTFADIGKDYNDEILYAIDDELYLKYRIVPTSDADDLEKKYEQKHGGDYEDRFGKFTKWDFETFREKFAPAKEVLDSVETTGTTFEFKQIFNGTSYFEWVVSDRPDFVFEMAEDSSDRMSQQWERNAFLVRPQETKYEIRPMTSKIKDIKGSPILYASPSEKIQRFKQKDCDDGAIEKPFFATESLLVGIDKYSRFEIQVPPLPGMPEQIEEKVLRKGEETIVEYGAVCLTRGDVERVAMTEIQRVHPRENTYLPSGSRMELGNNDRVKLEYFDGTKVTVYENEKYTLRIFETEDELIRAFESLQKKNQYGAFQGFTKTGESFFFTKYLHDPQGASDTTPPEIYIAGGTNISAKVFTPVSVDASRSRDTDSGIGNVWWDLYPGYDTDKDGDTTNDKDFPTDETVTPREVLKVSLPLYESEGTASVILHVEDEEGNHSQETLTITVTASQPQIEEATMRGRSILGSVRDSVEGIPIFVERNRRGQWEPIRQESIPTDRGGDFSMISMGTSGGIEIEDFANKEAFEILENGRPILLNDMFDIIVRRATASRPTSIFLRDEQETTITSIAFEIPGKENVVLDEDELSFTSESSVHVLDRNTKDTILFEKTKEGNVLISSQSAPLALIDKRGDFYGSLDLQLKRAKNENDPVVFEILGLKDTVVGEFVILLGEDSNMHVTRQ